MVPKHCFQTIKTPHLQKLASDFWFEIYLNFCNFTCPCEKYLVDASDFIPNGLSRKVYRLLYFITDFQVSCCDNIMFFWLKSEPMTDSQINILQFFIIIMSVYQSSVNRFVLTSVWIIRKVHMRTELFAVEFWFSNWVFELSFLEDLVPHLCWGSLWSIWLILTKKKSEKKKNPTTLLHLVRD